MWNTIHLTWLTTPIITQSADLERKKYARTSTPRLKLGLCLFSFYIRTHPFSNSIYNCTGIYYVASDIIIMEQQKKKKQNVQYNYNNNLLHRIENIFNYDLMLFDLFLVLNCVSSITTSATTKTTNSNSEPSNFFFHCSGILQSKFLAKIRWMQSHRLQIQCI